MAESKLTKGAMESNPSSISEAVKHLQDMHPNMVAPEPTTMGNSGPPQDSAYEETGQSYQNSRGRMKRLFEGDE